MCAYVGLHRPYTLADQSTGAVIESIVLSAMYDILLVQCALMHRRDFQVLNDTGNELSFIVQEEYKFVGLHRCQQRHRPIRVIRCVFFLILSLIIPVLEVLACPQIMLHRLGTATMASTR